MRTQAKFKEYIWLVNTINKARAISFADIQKKWLETDMMREAFQIYVQRADGWLVQPSIDTKMP